MFRITFILVLSLLFSILNTSNVYAIDDRTINDYTPYFWEPISDVEKVLDNMNPKDISKRTIDQNKIASEHYNAGIKLMQNKEYENAILEFKSAMKRYKKAKLNNDALNYIHANLALSYSNSGNNESAKRFLELLTKKIYDSNHWAYNISIAHANVGNMNEAVSLLSSCIRNNQFDFQSYVTLEAIYRDSGNQKDANRVRDRLETAEAKLIKKRQKEATKTTNTAQKKSEKKKNIATIKGKKPDVSNLIIVKEDDHLQFNKIDKIDERSMTQIEEGIQDYKNGVNTLSKKEYRSAQKYLKDAEKRLKRGKVTEDGLNFTRGNLAIAFLASGEKRGVGQSKRYLKYLTSKLYKSREWAYNIAVANYAFASQSRGSTKEEYLKKSIKLFNLSIKLDKLFLPAYENLIYIFKEEKEEKRALKAQKAYEKARGSLMKSFSKKEQLKQGIGDPYIFRVNLGTFGEYDTPNNIFNQDYLITVPINEQKTSYLAGMFYNLEDAVEYQKKMKKIGYSDCFIVAFKDGEKLEF